MPNALTFNVGANTGPFARDMATLDAIAKRTAVRMSTSLAGGGGGGGLREGGGGYRGIFRESLVIAREAAMGRGMARIAASGTLLVSYLANLFSGINKAGGAASAAADAYEKMVDSQTKLARASYYASQSLMEKAAAAEADGSATAAETAAALDNAIAAEAQGTASTKAALAYQAKAVAAREAATAEAAEATAGVSAFGIIASAVAATAAVIAIYYERVKELTRQYISVADIGKFNVSYIPQFKQAANAIAEAWNKMDESAQAVADKYNSAAESAKRLAEATKQAAAEQRALDEINRQTELAGARTPEERLEVEKRYLDIEKQRFAQQQAIEKKERADELNAVTAEVERKMNEAGAIQRGYPGGLPSPDADKESVRLAEDRLKGAQEALENAGPGFLQKTGAWTKIFWHYANSKGNLGKNNYYPSSPEEMYAPTLIPFRQMVTEAQKQLRDAENAAHEHDKAWDAIKKLTDEATAANDRAAQLQISGRDEEANAQRARAAFDEKQAAQLRLYSAQESKGNMAHGHSETLTAMQRIGGQAIFGISTAQLHLHVARMNERNTRGILRAVTTNQSGLRNSGGARARF